VGRGREETGDGAAPGVPTTDAGRPLPALGLVVFQPAVADIDDAGARKPPVTGRKFPRALNTPPPAPRPAGKGPPIFVFPAPPTARLCKMELPRMSMLAPREFAMPPPSPVPTKGMSPLPVLPLPPIASLCWTTLSMTVRWVAPYPD